MKITTMPRTGTSAKFWVTNKRGDFMISLSRTLYEKWGLATEDQQFDAANQMALAIVGRHTSAAPFKDKYIFAEHNTEPTLEQTVAYLHKHEL
jgi:hypothetical protein